MYPILGLEGLVTAELTADTSSALTYGAVSAVEGLIDVQLEDSSADSEPKFADNYEKFRLYKQAKMKLTIELLAAAQSTLAAFYGHSVAAGVTKKDEADRPVYRAFGFKADDGEGEQDGVWLLKCIPVKRTNGMTYHTKDGENTAVQTVKIEFDCMARVNDGEYAHMTNSGDESLPSWATWFDDVPGNHVITLSEQPADTAVTAGSISGTLDVTAAVTGGGAITYQWYQNTARSTSGATALSSTGHNTDSLTIPTALTAGNYYFYCVASSAGAASVVSDIAVVIVQAAD
jgi:phi13 family phage major tail protein